MDPVGITRRLAGRVDRMRFSAPVAYVYNPLRYAWAPHKAYLERYGKGRRKFVLLGMNPGPFGMAQTGVPFGEVAHARDWLGLDAAVKRPKREHPKRPIQGFSCARSEVSGARLWGWARERFKTPKSFFKDFIILNYCPLAFLESGGRNLTPDKLPARERAPLEKACDDALGAMLEYYKPEMVIGVGAFAQKRASLVVGNRMKVGTILHPSPASPAANRGWAPQAEKQLKALGAIR